MKRFFFLIKYGIKKLLIVRLFATYVEKNKTIQQDINQTIAVRGCTVQPNTLKKRFSHLMLYYPDFAFIFFWR
ncbi:hypothetical protein, partial [Polaribacter sp.]|uniref:hypothetical protein n=1 Tax=Polaribacter sp. TaxID=1920175 RepID=UPI0032970914